MSFVFRIGRLRALIFSVVALCAATCFGAPISITNINSATLTVLPVNGSTNYVNPMTISGTAIDPLGVTGVFFSLNSSNAWQTAKTSSNGAISVAFTASLMMTSGPNYVLVKSVAIGGAVSAITRVDYTYVPRSAKAQTVAPGSEVTLQVADKLPLNATYQWQFNEANIPGATSSTYVIPSATLANEGLYRVVVSTYQGTAQTSEIALRLSPIVVWGQTADLQAPVGLMNVTAIAGGSDHLLALKSDGTVAAWGNWMDGAMPEVTNVPPALSNVVAISACDGQNMVAKSDGTVVCFGHNMPPVPGGLNDVVAVACAGVIEIALKNDGTVVQWSSKKTVDPTANDIAGVVQIAGGHDRWAALIDDGTVVLYADDGFGNIVPNAVPEISDAVSISCGGWQCLATHSDGTVSAFGGTPTVKSNLGNVVAVASPWSTSYAIKGDGSLAAWGYNGNGQTNVPDNVNAIQVVGGSLYGAALVNGSPRTLGLHLATKIPNDQTPPNVTVVTPKQNSHTTSVTMTGVCGEGGQVTHVYYKLYMIDEDPPDDAIDVAAVGTIVPSTQKNRWNFSATLTPHSGTNVLEVYAVDAWGNQSATVTRTFVFEVPVTFNLSIGGDGPGRVFLTPASYSGPKLRLDATNGPASMVASLYLNETYTLTAQPLAGASFSNWMGAVSGTSPSVSFTAVPGLSAQASFIANRFVKGWRGNYNGLFRQTSAVRFETAGALNNLVIGNSGQFSGLLGIQGQRVPVAGTFSPLGAGSCTATVGTETLTVNMQLDFTNPLSLVGTGSVKSSAGWIANLDLRKTGNGISQSTGRANLIVTTPNAAVATPAGFGNIQAAVNASGQASLTGALSDGSVVMGSWGVTRDGVIAFYAPLYGGGGMAWGWLPVSAVTSNGFNGDLIWIKKQSVGDPKYPAGFTNDFAVSGSTYSQAITSAYNGLTGTLTISGGDLAAPLNFPMRFVVKANSPVKLVKQTGAPANMLTLTVSPKGVVQGAFGENVGDAGGPSLYGLMLQNQRTIEGFWINNNLSGKFVLNY